RPQPREVEEWRTPDIAKIKVYYRAKIRPKPRVQVGYVQVLAAVDVVSRSVDVSTYALASTRPVYRSPRPLTRPASLASSFTRKTYSPTPVRVTSTKPTAISLAGSLCGDARIKGEVMAAIVGILPGCGLENPVRVHSVDGVVLGQHSIMDCQTAKALTGWVSNSLKPLIHRRGGGVKSLSVPSHYSCRTRNSQPGAKISEHGKGHAIDISSINLNDGTKITVLDGWKDFKDRKILRRLHAAACGPFGTVLGPEANKYHLDHFHFDTARYRSGAFCE
ncbi:MAG: hypothetical protein ACI861_001673, partial [Paracoccaceae bacterium]